MAKQPGFAAFYRELHGFAPFPWQKRLAADLAAGKGWPTEVGVQTGLGKTSCLDIAVWWLASQADRPPTDRDAPTRIWWLVNRRLLVDATWTHAERLSGLLSTATTPALSAVAGRLRSLSANPDAPPLEIIRLRGGVETSRPTDPSQPAVLLSTLPMYGSRLLFRGYGTSRSMRPVDAALAGTDSLVLVDEAHLAHHLLELFTPLSDCDRSTRAVAPPARLRPKVVALTATGHADPEHRFELDTADFAHPVVARRLDAAKPVRIVDGAPSPDVSELMADTAVDILSRYDRPVSMVVFTNTPATARQVAHRLNHRTSLDAELVVLTGRTREREAKAARDRILDEHTGVKAGAAPVDRDRHLIVVATQTLEVGADVDFETLVTEACGVRALTQRLGRLNRLGAYDDAEGAYVHVEPPTKAKKTPSWPVYGDEPLEVLSRLRKAAKRGAVQLNPRRVGAVLGAPLDDPGRAPEILPALLREWVKTTNPPPGEAPVEPYIAGIARPERNVTVYWRAYVPSPGERIWPRVRDAEAVEVPLGEVREALRTRGIDGLRLGADRVTIEGVDLDGLRPGDTVLLPSDAGLLDEHGWAPDTNAPVIDMAVLADGLPLDLDAIARLVAPSPPVAKALRSIVDPADGDDTPVEAQVQELLEALGASEPWAIPADEWHDLLDNLELAPVFTPDEIPRLVRRHAQAVGPSDELDELSLSTTAIDLTRHGGGVGRRAVAVAEKVGLPADLVAAVELAGRLHDTGKADARFQRWLDPDGNATGLLAKSNRARSKWIGDRVASGWPAGGRHEALSARLAEQWLVATQPNNGLDDTRSALVLHLVISHHGHGRPFLAPVPDNVDHHVSIEIHGTPVQAFADLSCPDWTQPDRFWDLAATYGHWGLALLEAIVRQADHAVSAGGWAGDKQVI